MAAQVADLSAGDLLEEVDALRHRQRQTSAELLGLVAEFARQHGEGTIDPTQARRPGRQRAVRLGGVGTPLVAEYAPTTLAARMQLSPHSGGRLVADVLDLEHRLPRLWARVGALEVDEQHARFVARKTRHLSAEEAAQVDARVAPLADGRLTWTRFEALVEAAIIAADPATAEAREQAAARESFAKTTHSTEHGMRGFYLRADFATIARIDATVAYLAEALLALGDDLSLDQRRVKAVLLMANPTHAVQILTAYQTWHRNQKAREATESSETSEQQSTPPLDAPERDAKDPDAPEPVATEPQRFDPTETPETPDPADLLDETKLLPAVWLYVHLATDQGSESSGVGDVARIEGAPPVTSDWVRRHLGERCRFKITPVMDPLDQVPVDAWEIPQRHRQAVHLLTPADTFPYASSTTRKQQIDHTVAYTRARAEAGEQQSRIGNYGPMVTFHHRIKTHSDWTVHQPRPGVYLWRDPHGATYRVDHTGTHRLPKVDLTRPPPWRRASSSWSSLPRRQPPGTPRRTPLRSSRAVRSPSLVSTGRSFLAARPAVVRSPSLVSTGRSFLAARPAVVRSPSLVSTGRSYLDARPAVEVLDQRVVRAT